MFSWIKKLYAPDAEALAKQQLEQARRGLLTAQSSSEFYACQATYYKGVIARLSKPSTTVVKQELPK